MVAPNAIQRSLRTPELMRRLPAIVLPEHEGRKGLEDCRAAYPQDGIAHLDWIVELNRKPLGCGAGGQDKGNRSPDDRSDIPASLPTRTIRENVSGRRCCSVLHGMPPRIEEYISLPEIAKSVPPVPRPLRHSGAEGAIELAHPSFVRFPGGQIHRTHPAHDGAKRLLVARMSLSLPSVEA